MFTGMGAEKDFFFFKVSEQVGINDFKIQNIKNQLFLNSHQSHLTILNIKNQLFLNSHQSHLTILSHFMLYVNIKPPYSHL